MNEKKKSNQTKQKPEHTIRHGEVTASIYMRQSNCGYPYYDFALTRSWKSMTTGKEAHGTTFFVKNRQDLVKVINEASNWIHQRMVAVISKETFQNVQNVRYDVNLDHSRLGCAYYDCMKT